MNEQLDQIANRIDTNLSLIKENADRIALLPTTRSKKFICAMERFAANYQSKRSNHSPISCSDTYIPIIPQSFVQIHIPENVIKT